MGMIKEFKEFALKGNLIDTAIAFVMGAAFGKVVSAFVEKMFSPLVGLLLGGVDLTKKKWEIIKGVTEIKDSSGNVITPAINEVSVQWGAFLTASIDFIVVAFVMFLIIKAMNKMKKADPETVPEPASLSTTDSLLAEIRDSLKK